MSEDDTITPFFDDPVTDIHPAIGVVDGTAYIGVWVPCLVTNKEGHNTSRDFMYLITSNRQEILCTVPELVKRYWRLEYKPIHTPNRWNLVDVQKYVLGESVDVAKVYETVESLYRKYIELPAEKSYVLHTLWSIGTYFCHLFNTYPYLYIGGVKRSGKTKTLTLHYCVDFNGVLSGNMSVSSVYRVIQNQRATLMLDETETLNNPERAQAFRNVLLSGYKKGILAYRVGPGAQGKGDRLEPESYEVYGGKVIANIAGLEDVLEDRCITDFQKRSRNKAIINKEIDLLDPRFSQVRHELCKLFLLHWKDVKAIYDRISQVTELTELIGESSEASEYLIRLPDKLPEGSEYLAGRELELWKPILTIALFFDNQFKYSQGSLGSLILELAATLASRRHTENTTEVRENILVGCLLKLVAKNQLTVWVKVKTIKEEMQNQFDEPQDWITSQWLGSALRRLGFTDKRRIGTGYQYNIAYSVLEDLKGRLEVEETKGPEPEDPPRSCCLCLKQLPNDHLNVTTYDGKEVHIECYQKIREGLNKDV